MPKLWSVRDGPRASATRGEGTPTTYAEIKGAFGKYPPTFISEGPPQFNVDKPSRFPSHIVVEVNAEDDLASDFPRMGFYVLEDLPPDVANKILYEYRKKK